MPSIPHTSRPVIKDHIFPLAGFSPEKQAEIARQVAQPKPPPKWLDLGLAQIPSRAWWEWHWQRGIDPDKRRPRLDPTLRSQVIERDGYVCQLCGNEVEPEDVHIDHIFPRSLGGSDSLKNLQVTHSVCNLRKGAKV